MTFVIAEVGVNHQGSVSLAQELIDEAKRAGADAVKFQAFSSQRLWGDDRIAHLELSDAELTHLAWHAKDIGIEWLCTPFGIEEVKFLRPLVKRFKVASGCLARWGLLHAIRDTNLPVILSTGMSGLMEIERALNALGHGTPALYQQDFTLLHCVSSYPCRAEDANLMAMDTLRWQWGKHAAHVGRGGIICKIGYSDHTAGIVVALAAVALGATVLEKHLTFDRNAEGPDHKASIEPKEFRIMVDAIRTVESALGDGIKAARECEAAVKAQWYGN